MNNLKLVLVLCFVIILSCSFDTAYEIVGDSVVYENSFAKLKVTPHTAYSPINNFEQVFTVENKRDSSGDLCMAYVFEKELLEADVWLEREEFFYNC